jgi:hypothetical protein
VPSKPRPDLLAYLASTGIAAIYPEGDKWMRVDAPGSSGVALAQL